MYSSATADCVCLSMEVCVFVCRTCVSASLKADKSSKAAAGQDVDDVRH